MFHVKHGTAGWPETRKVCAYLVEPAEERSETPLFGKRRERSRQHPLNPRQRLLCLNQHPRSLPVRDPGIFPLTSLGNVQLTTTEPPPPPDEPARSTPNSFSFDKLRERLSNPRISYRIALSTQFYVIIRTGGTRNERIDY